MSPASKFISPLVVGLIALACIFHSGCAMNSMYGPRMADFKDIINYHMKMDPETNTPILVSGIATSTFCIKSISKKVEGDSVIILMNLGLCNKGESGDFFIPLEIPDNINRLTFGEDRHVLWERGGYISPSANQ